MQSGERAPKAPNRPRFRDGSLFHHPARPAPPSLAAPARAAAAFGVALALVLAGPRPVHACSCAPSSILDAYEESPGVFVAVVNRITGDSLDGGYTGSLHVEAVVVESWKGPALGPITLYTASNTAACGYPFDEGVTYLVFAYESEAGWQVSLCRETQPVADVEEAAAILSGAVVTGGDCALDRGALAEPGRYRLESPVWERAGSTDLATLLWPLPGVAPVRRSTLTSDVTLRGLGGPRTLVLMDGFRLGSALRGGPPAGDLGLIAPSSLRAVDVDLGVRSARYGSGALGGVVRLTSLPRPLGGVVRGTLDLRAQTADPGIDEITGFEVHTPPLRLAAGGHLDVLGDRAGAPPLDAELQTSHARFGGYLRPEVRTDVGTFSVGVLGGFGGQTFEDEAEEATAELQMRSWLLVWLGWQRQGLAAHLSNLDLRVGFLRQRERWPDLPERGGTETVRRVQLLARADTPWLPWLTQRWTADLDVETLEVQGLGESSEGGSVLDGSHWVLGSFGTGLGVSPGRTTTVDLDGRVDLMTADAPAPEGAGTELSEATGSGALEVRQRVGDNVTTRVTVASGNRVPNLRELYVRERREDVTTTPNDGLTAEQALGVDGGVRWAFDPVAFELVGHYTRLYDLIALAPTGLVDAENLDAFGVPRPILQAANLGDARLYGVEGIVSGHLADVRTYATVAWTRGDDLTAHRPLAFVPPVNGHVAVMYSSPIWGAGAWLRWAARQERNGPGERETDGYAVLGVDGYYRFAWWGRAVVALDNVTHRGYRTHASQVPETGFNATIAFQVFFEPTIY